MWDDTQEFVVYPDTLSTSFSSSDSSSNISSDSNSSVVDSEAEERQLLQEIFVDTMVEAINKAVPINVFNGEKSERRRKKMIERNVPKMFRTLWRHCDDILTHGPVNQSIS